jgi:hypothetical protein
MEENQTENLVTLSFSGEDKSVSPDRLRVATGDPDSACSLLESDTSCTWYRRKNKVSISKASKQIPVQRFMIRYEKCDDKSHYAEKHVGMYGRRKRCAKRANVKRQCCGAGPGLIHTKNYLSGFGSVHEIVVK